MSDRITAAAAEYLEWIYRLSKVKEAVSPLDLARALKVSPPSVTAMLKRLSAAGWVEYRTYQGISLTPEGQRLAATIVRRHGLLERLLTDVLGVPWEKVDDLACQLEHYLTDEVEMRLAAFLGNPTTCPHGRPIDLEQADHSRLLSDMALGEEAEVLCITDEDTEFLRYLSELGMRPGARVCLQARAPFNGPLTVRVDQKTHAIGRDVADRVRVAGTSKAAAC